MKSMEYFGGSKDDHQKTENLGNVLFDAERELDDLRRKLEAIPINERNEDDTTVRYLKDLKDSVYKTQRSLKSKAESFVSSKGDMVRTLPILIDNRSEKLFHGYSNDSSGYGDPLLSARISKFPKYRVLSPKDVRKEAGEWVNSQPLSEREKEKLRKEHNRRSSSSFSRSGSRFDKQDISFNPHNPRSVEHMIRKYNSSGIETLLRPQKKYVKERKKRGYSGKLRKKSLHHSKGVKYGRRPENGNVVVDEEELDGGILDMINTGKLPKGIDVSEALTEGPQGLLQPKRATFHSFYDKFDRNPVQLYGGVDGMIQYKFDIEEKNDTKYEEQGQSLELVLSDNSAPVDRYKEQIRRPEVKIVRKPKELKFDGELGDVLPSSMKDSDNKENDLIEFEKAEKSRKYEELLDAYSLHRFIIRKGRAINDTPEFRSYKRKYKYIWEPLSFLIRALEEFLKEYKIDLAYVDGQKLVELAENESREPTIRDIVMCIVNTKEVSQIFNFCGLQFAGPNGKEYAASKIQATFRMFVQKKKYSVLLFRSRKARKIQIRWQRYRRLQQTRKIIDDKWKLNLKNWEEHIQKPFTEKWSTIERQHRVIVHIPSLSLSLEQRLNRKHFNILENSQIGRICDVKSPEVDVIYVSPFEIPGEIKSYLLKLLEVGNNKEDYSKRVHFIHSKDSLLYPPHISLSKLILFSHDVIKKLKKVICGRVAYIIPNTVGEEDLQLAVALGLPMLAPPPTNAAVFSSKSGNKRIFAGCSIPTPPGVHDIYDEEDFFMHLAKLIIQHLEVQRWIFKMDDRTDAEGIAYIQPFALKVYHTLYRERQKQLVRWGDPHVALAAQERMYSALKIHLPEIVTFACPNLYNNSWKEYAKRFFCVGGVIEASPTRIVSSPAVNVLIEPDGTVDVLHTYDQLFHSTYRYCGAVFPSSTHSGTLQLAANKVARQCYKEGIIGYLSVEFIVYEHLEPHFIDDGGHKKEEMKYQHRMWAVDLKLHMTNSLSSFKLFEFLIGESGKYLHKEDVKNNLNSGNCYVPVDEENSVLSSEQISKWPNSTYLQKRCFASTNLMYQPSLAAIQFPTFFNLLRMRGLSFDLRTRKGTVFAMPDSLASGLTGVVCIGESPKDAIARLSNVCDFLVEQTTELEMGGGGGGSGLVTNNNIDDVELVNSLVDVHFSVKSLLQNISKEDEDG